MSGRQVVSCLLVIILTIACFAAGLVLPDSPGDAAQAGVAFGVLSAIAWGLCSISAAWRNWTPSANLFAALFAATSLGFLLPRETCDTGLFARACTFRSISLRQ